MNIGSARAYKGRLICLTGTDTVSARKYPETRSTAGRLACRLTGRPRASRPTHRPAKLEGLAKLAAAAAARLLLELAQLFKAGASAAFILIRRRSPGGAQHGLDDPTPPPPAAAEAIFVQIVLPTGLTSRALHGNKAASKIGGRSAASSFPPDPRPSAGTNQPS